MIETFFRTYTLSGAYRKILERVTDLSWKIMGYDVSTASLIRSDYEEIKGHPEPKNSPGELVMLSLIRLFVG